MSESRFAGQVAVVTGAAGGIGLATARRLAREGARVLAVDIKPFADIGPGIETLEASVTAPDGPACILDAAARLGRLSILVNNAGIGGSHRADATDDAEFDRFIDGNLRSVFRLSREAVARMAGGAIVNIASIFGMTGFPGSAAYAAAKAGVIGLTMQMAADYGALGVRVNAVSPGLIETSMTRNRIATSAWFRGMMTEMTPLGRTGQPEDVAAAVAFLASQDAAFISAHVLAVDGGWLNTRWRAPEA